jgi:alpha-galactosidase
MAGAFTDVAEIPLDPARARVYEHGWQSWSPTTTYALDERPWRPRDRRRQVMGWRPDRDAPADAFQGEGLLAVDPGDGGPVEVFAAPDGANEVPSIRAVARGSLVVVRADGRIERRTDGGPGGIDGALGRWAEAYAARTGVPPPRPAPTIWCSWYHYFTKVTEADVLENLDTMDELDLPVDVVQIDDGYEAEIGDWRTLSGRFASLDGLVGRIRERGRRAGIWVAPFLVGARSALHAEHPDWLVGGADGGANWDQPLSVLDVTHPDAAAWLAGALAAFRAAGIDFFKVDFLYAGAIDGARHQDVPALEAYRHGIELIRVAVGPDAYLLGCGAPILPSVGLFDAMRISPDVAPTYEPRDGDLSAPSQRAAALTGAARAFQHGRFWVNDPDCLVARPAVERREQWAAHVERYGGLRGSSDRLRDLDDWGLATTRRLLTTVPSPDAGLV